MRGSINQVPCNGYPQTEGLLSGITPPPPPTMEGVCVYRGGGGGGGVVVLGLGVSTLL